MACIDYDTLLPLDVTDDLSIKSVLSFSLLSLLIIDTLWLSSVSCRCLFSTSQWWHDRRETVFTWTAANIDWNIHNCSTLWPKQKDNYSRPSMFINSGLFVQWLFTAFKIMTNSRSQDNQIWVLLPRHTHNPTGLRPNTTMALSAADSVWCCLGNVSTECLLIDPPFNYPACFTVLW